jgi:O-antigen/teichoic acid export membrane protein
LLNRHFRNASWGGFSAAFRAGYGLLNVLLSIRLLGVDSYGDVATLLAFFVLYASLNSSIFTVIVVKLMAKEENGISLSNKAVPMSGLLFVISSISFLFSIVILLEILAPLILFFKEGTKNLILAFAVLTSTQILTGFFAALIEG